MKATIERATLLKCLSHVQSVVERRNTIPILSNVLIEAASDGTLKVMATDLDLQVVESLGAGYLSGSYKDIYAFILLIIVLMVRPAGMFGVLAKVKALAAAMANTPVPQPKSNMRAGRSRFKISSSAERQPAVVPWCPVPNAVPASISRETPQLRRSKRSCEPCRKKFAYSARSGNGIL